MEIFIPGNTPSSKNSKVWTGKFLVNSAVTQRYKENTKKEWLSQKQLFLAELGDKPYYIGLYFIRDSKRRFDYVNIAQIVFDLMQEYGYLEDDCMTEVIPVFLGYHVDKENAGVCISVLSGYSEIVKMISENARINTHK